MDSTVGTDLIESVLTRLLATSVQTVVLVAAIWVLCRWLPTLSAGTRCRLWWLVAVQSVLGLLWGGAVHLPVLPAVSAPPAALASVALPSASQVIAADAAAVAKVGPAHAARVVAAPAPTLAWSQALVALWLAGVLLCAVRSGLAYRRSRRQARQALPCTDRALLGALQLAAQAHGLRRAPQLRLCAQTDSPQLIGPWRPVLLLPARRMAALRADDLDMALTHELVHLQRRDLWWGLLPALAQHLFFFHPLVHLAAREYALAREAACDAAVVAGHRHCRHDYARLLVHLGVAPRPSAGLASASSSFLCLKRRLLMLQTTSTFPRLGATLILGAVALLGVAPLRLVAQPGHAAAAAAQSLPARASLPPSAAALGAGADAVAEVAADAASDAADVAEAASERAEEAAADTADVADAGEAARAANVSGSPLPPRAAAPALPALPATPAAARRAAPVAPPVIASGASTRSMQKTRNGQVEQSYVRVKGNSTTMRGSSDDLVRAKAEVGDDGLWFSRGDRRYVIRDPALLARFDALFEPMGQLGIQQGELGKRQGALGREQGELGRELGKLVQESVALAMDRMDSRGVAAKARERAQADLTRRQDALSAQMRALGQQQGELGRQQGELGARQSTLSAHADREAERLFDAAIADGRAQRLN